MNSASSSGQKQPGQSAVEDLVAVRRAAMDLLARREHSRVELERKLARRFASAGLIEQVIQALAEESLQSDARFAQSFARQRSQRGYGPLRIKQELRQKGLSDSGLSEAMASLDVDWWALAQAVCRKKFGDLAPVDRRDKARRLRFLQYRGFDAETVRALLE